MLTFLTLKLKTFSDFGNEFITGVYFQKSYIYIYIYTRVDLSLYSDRVCWNPEVKFQSRIVDTISKFRHPVVKVSIADNDSKMRQRQ